MGVRKHFSEEELEYIKEEYMLGRAVLDIAREFNVYYSMIQSRLIEMNIFEYRSQKWTEQEISLLRNHYPITSWEKLLIHLNRWTKEEIISKAYKLKIRRDISFWTEDNISILTIEYEKGTSAKEISKLLNEKFSEPMVNCKAHNLGLYKREWWSKDEIDILKEHYPYKTVDEVMLLLPNRKRLNIIDKAGKLGLKNVKTMTTPSYTKISAFLRSNNKKWIRKSLANSNGKCVISNMTSKTVHHLHGFNLIVDETLKRLGYSETIEFNKLISQELDSLLHAFRSVQDKYPLGVCLLEDIHKVFHNKYGYGNNTIEQFEEFKSYMFI